ncbi:MAG: hypothetical protein ACLTS1_08110 [Coprococcus sp.]
MLYGKGFIRDELCGCTFRISPKSFYQVNPVQTEILYQKAIEFAHLTGKESVIDAYIAEPLNDRSGSHRDMQKK